MMLSPRLDRLGVRPLEIEDADELHALVDGNREHLARWMPWAAGQDREGTERFTRPRPKSRLIRTDGFQAAVEPDGEILGVVGFHSIDWTNRNTSLGYWLAADAQGRDDDHHRQRPARLRLLRVELTGSRSTALLRTSAAARSPSASAFARKRACARPSWSAGAISTASCTGCWNQSGRVGPPEQMNPPVWARWAFALGRIRPG